jgi:pilus assembly protein CpaB
MAKMSSKMLLIVAGVLSVGAALLAYHLLDGYQQTTSGQQNTTVVIAKKEILPNTVITEEMVEQVKIPVEYLQPGAMTDMGGVVGVHTAEHIMAREQITERLLSVKGRVAGFSGIIPKDKRAFSIAVNDTTGVAGLLKPGDYIDIIVTVNNKGEEFAESFANMTIQNVLVLAANKVTGRAGADQGSTFKEGEKIANVTLAVTPDEATKLALAVVKGQVALALRPLFPLDNGFTPVLAKTADSLRGGLSLRSAPAAGPPVVAAQPSGSIPASRTKAVSVIRGTNVANVALQ